MSSNNNSTLSPVSSQPIPYSAVHTLFVSLVLIAGKRHDKRPWLALLVAALSPVDDAAKLANLKRIENEMEACRD